jgi:hypothetical protein
VVGKAVVVVVPQAGCVMLSDIEFSVEFLSS